MDSSPSQSASASPSPSPAPSNAQEQARLRRERRQAKIAAGGASRLNKITSLSGRPAEPAPPIIPSTAPASSPASAEKPAEDPDEVDISQHFYTPPRGAQGNAAQPQISQDQLRQMMLNFDPTAAGVSPNAPGNAFLGGNGQQQQQQGPGAEGEEPMMQMLQQMMGGAGGGEGGLPPGLAAMLGGQQQDQQPAQDKYGYLWRIVHALFALALGVYITAATTFSGSHFSRAESLDGEVGVRFFWVFATAELVLQSSRFFMEKGKAPQAGLLGGLGAMLPEPYGGYVRVVNRYSVIYTTVVADAMVVVFVLGCVAWWKGMVA